MSISYHFSLSEYTFIRSTIGKVLVDSPPALNALSWAMAASFPSSAKHHRWALSLCRAPVQSNQVPRLSRLSHIHMQT